VFGVHLPSIGFEPQILCHLVRVKGQGYVTPFNFRRARNVLKLCMVVGSRMANAGPAVTINAFSKTEKPRFFLELSIQSEISGGVRTPEIMPKCLVHS
jgi:hypothetical protein